MQESLEAGKDVVGDDGVLAGRMPVTAEAATALLLAGVPTISVVDLNLRLIEHPLQMRSLHDLDEQLRQADPEDPALYYLTVTADFDIVCTEERMHCHVRAVVLDASMVWFTWDTNRPVQRHRWQTLQETMLQWALVDLEHAAIKAVFLLDYSHSRGWSTDFATAREVAYALSRQHPAPAAAYTPPPDWLWRYLPRYSIDGTPPD